MAEIYRNLIIKKKMTIKEVYPDTMKPVVLAMLSELGYDGYGNKIINK